MILEFSEEVNKWHSRTWRENEEDKDTQKPTQEIRWTPPCLFHVFLDCVGLHSLGFDVI
uniref:Uncharacterized protein n=1 Tax=Anguilla anguilla TaxID=7936 RepID=A0A0E9VDF5_ANGAN